MSYDDGRSASPDAVDYDNTHRAFLQAFLARSVLSVDDIKPLLAAIVTTNSPDRPLLIGDVTTSYLTTFIQTINARPAPLDYEIRSTRSQTTKDLVYALINTSSDTLTQLATTFSAEEIAYIKRLLDCMFETNNTSKREIMAVPQVQASQLVKAPRGSRQSQINGDAEDGATQTEAPVKGITMADGDKVLSTLVEQQFLEKSRANFYSLAPRALMELRAFLKETYNDPADPEDEESEPVIRIRDCEACREMVTVGVRCNTRACIVRFHDECAVQYFRSQRGGTRKCPTCKGDWKGDSFVGERAANMGPRRSTQNGRSSAMRMDVDGEDDAE